MSVSSLTSLSSPEWSMESQAIPQSISPFIWTCSKWQTTWHKLQPCSPGSAERNGAERTCRSTLWSQDLCTLFHWFFLLVSLIKPFFPLIPFSLLILKTFLIANSSPIFLPHPPRMAHFFAAWPHLAGMYVVWFSSLLTVHLLTTLFPTYFLKTSIANLLAVYPRIWLIWAISPLCHIRVVNYSNPGLPQIVL